MTAPNPDETAPQTDPDLAAAAQEADLRLASQMRALSQISPAVAHDLRAPINAMVFNIEILKETISAHPALEQAGKERQLRYIGVLKEELSRLHRALEIFLSHTSPRGDRTETFDLREVAEEFASLLVAPARKQQVQVHPMLGEEKVPVEGRRYLIRQALLHVGLAALTQIPKQGILEVRLERQGETVRIQVGGTADPEAPPIPDFEPILSSEGTLAQLGVARSIVNAHGGEVRRPEISGADLTFEVELRVSEKE